MLPPWKRSRQHTRRVLRLHSDKNMNNVANTTQLFKRFNACHEDWKRGSVQEPLKDDLPCFHFNPTYFRLNFCGCTS